MSLTDVLDVAGRHYRNGLRVKRRAQRRADQQWATMDPGAPERWWDRVGLQLVLGLADAKVAVAEQASAYLEAIVEAGRWFGPEPDYRLVPDVFGEESADGRPLDDVLFNPVLDTLTALRSGTPPARAREVGRVSLARIVGTEVADAGRTADQVAATTRPQMVGYVRLLTPPSCPRCVVLAGKFYRWNEGFYRHPNCDCRHVPSAEAIDGQAVADPAKAVRDGLVHGLSKADEQAILDGADPSQVINASSGMYTADGVKFTSAGTTRNSRGTARGLAGQRLGRGARRLRPEAIYRIAETRQQALDLLWQHGYIM